MFLVPMVSRLTEQKVSIISEMQNLVQFDVQVIVLGTGDANFEHDFRYFADTYPEKVGAAITFDWPKEYMQGQICSNAINI